jgi:hypothetical protein
MNGIEKVALGEAAFFFLKYFFKQTWNIDN